MVQLYRRKSAEFVANSVTAGDQLATFAGGGFFSGVAALALDIVASTDSVNEIAVENTAVLRLSTDSGVNSGNTYILLADSTGGAFRIDGDLLVIADTLLLDHETAPSVSVTIRVTDLNGNTHDETFALTVTDAAVERRLVASDEAQINDTQNWNQGTADVAALASGGYVVTWTDTSPLADGTGSAVKAQIFTAAGTAVGNEFVVNTTTSATQEDAAVTGLASGGFAVTWYDNGAIKAQILDAAGVKVGGEISVSAAGGGSIHQWPDIASVADGGFVVAWMVSGTAGDGSGQAIRMQLFDAAGVKVGGEQIVNTTTDGDQMDVALAGLGGGGFVATWTDVEGEDGEIGAAVRAQLFDAAGNKLGGEILVNSITFRSQADPAVAALGSGRFVITWTDSSGFPEVVVKAQIFAPDGTKIGGEIVVTPPGGGYDSSVTALADGGFAVSWFTDFGEPDADSVAIRAQLFDLNGHKIGGDFEVSRGAGTPTQDQSGLAGLAAGGLVATWADDSGPINDIMTRLYLPPPLSLPGPPIIGTAGMDFLVGTQGADIIQGLGGLDRLEGREGDDVLEGGEGNDTLIAGLGDDLLEGGAGDDLLIGGEDDDALYGEEGDDVLIYQSFSTGNFVAVLDGGIGDDEVSFFTYGYDATATLTGGEGNDSITADGGAHVAIDAGTGNDFVYLPNLGTRFDISLGGGRDLLALTGYPDLFVQSAGTNISDFAVGDGGDQLALAQYLTIHLLGWDQVTNPFATGHLQLVQRDADTVIRLDRDGSAGGGHGFADLIVLQNVVLASLTARNIGFATNGSATPGMTIDGTADLDLLAGAGGNDLIRGLGGNDRLFGGTGNDRLEGGAGRDNLTGDAGDDLLYGGGDQDTIGDSHGNDQMFGEGGDDLILVDRQYLIGAATTVLADGGADNDNLIFIGRRGLDDATLIGGAGEDLITVFGGGAIIIDGGDGPEIITIDVTALSYRITFGADPFSSDILQLTYVPAPLTSFTVVDFTTGNGGDILQMGDFLTQALTGWDGIANPLSTGHLLLAQSGADALILIDRDGGGDNFALLGRLENVTASQLTVVNLGFLPTQIAIAGTENADIVNGTGAPDHLYGLGGNDVLVAGLGDDQLDGGAGNDILYGEGGADIARGGTGDDVYIVDSMADVTEEVAGEGNDTIITTLSYILSSNQEIETLSTQAHAGTDDVFLTGNQYDNTLIGNAGDNIMNGVDGADVMYGLDGDDTYAIDNLGDLVVDGFGQGNDLVFTYLSHTLSNGNQIETLSTVFHQGTDAIDLGGNDYDNTLIGNYGANYLNGNGGVDVMIGLYGNDIYVADNAADQVLEDAGGGADALFSFVSYTLAAGQEVETVSTAVQGGTAAIDLTGNALAQTIIGNAGANLIDGKGGNDTLYGLGGADTFAFTTGLGAGNVDTLADFAAGTDRIGLDDAIFTAIGGTLAASAFVIGTAATDADDRIVYDSATGALLYDADGVGGAAAVQFATLSTGLALTASDFMVI